MMKTAIRLVCVVSTLQAVAEAFAPPQLSQHNVQQMTAMHATPPQDNDAERSDVRSSRRQFFQQSAATMMLTTMTAMSAPQIANAIPMVTTDEFSIILRDSPLSIELVEFTGPKSETVTVRLVDGTVFGLKDVIESSSDPRSPLKVAAACRENGVKFKFSSMEAALASVPRKKTLYTNQRVQDAAEKEREKAERIRRDEEDRLMQLRKMNEE
mmetsp:Transcript_14216/g.39156  ORF Transcript_14216/g.39156 Transcript_14216/m.39156 type:complete len:212 (-) Transcript_14216:1291-1926(-)